MNKTIPVAFRPTTDPQSVADVADFIATSLRDPNARPAARLAARCQDKARIAKALAE